MKELILPEYGRNIQNMVEIAMTIPDRNERNRCARSIINCMGNLFPYLRDNDAFQHKLWDHLALMSNFQLDIDYPYEITPAEQIHPTPEAIPIPNNQIRERHYGRFIDNFILRISNDPKIINEPVLITMIANYMKRCYHTYNQEIINDDIIFDDLFHLSNGAIDLRGKDIKLQDVQYKKNNKNKK
jgi:hypothetical protein